MDILLLEPPPTNQFGNMRQFGSIGTYKAKIAYPPIDLMKIAGYLRKFNIKCAIHDANTLKSSIGDIIKLVQREAPKLVVFTTSTTAITQDMIVARKIKALSRNILTATFGAHIKGAARQTLEEFPSLDIAIYGDQEMAVKELALHDFQPEHVGGIFYRRAGEIIENPPHPPVNNLDEYGIAAHDMIDPSLYCDPFARRLPLTVTYGQIGCVNRCTYCMSTLYGNLRMRTVPHFLEELKLIAKLGFKEVFFIDCGFTNNRKWADDLLDGMLAATLDLTWWCLSRADRLDEDIIKKMKSAGCHSIGIGVESANPQIINNVKKKVDTERVVDMVQLIHKHGMRALLYFQFGLPGETKATMQESLDYAKRSGADLVTFGIATPVPGTHFYDFMKEQGMFLTSDWERFDPTLPPVFSYKDLSSDEIFEFSQKAYKSFYMRPSFILKKFKGLRSFREFKIYAENFVNLTSRVFKSKK